MEGDYVFRNWSSFLNPTITNFHRFITNPREELQYLNNIYTLPGQFEAMGLLPDT